MTTTDKGTFIPTAQWDALVSALTDLHDTPYPFDAPVARRAWIENEIKIALGTIGDVWPLEIYGAVTMAFIEHSEKQHAH